MTHDRRTLSQMRSLCGELHEDDGVDPRRYFKTERLRDKTNRKTKQLCKQVAQTVDLLLAGEFADAQLHCLQVESVEPAPNVSQLAVTVRPVVTSEKCDPSEVLRRLDAVKGRLRSEVAAAITRKMAPRLVFRINSGPPSVEEESRC